MTPHRFRQKGNTVQLPLFRGQSVFPANEWLRRHGFEFEVEANDMAPFNQNMITITDGKHELLHYSVSSVGNVLRFQAEVWRRGVLSFTKFREAKIDGNQVTFSSSEDDMEKKEPKPKQKVQLSDIIRW